MRIQAAFKYSFLFLACQFSYAFAGPEGGSVASGDVSIQGQGTGQVVVNQSTNKAIINWQTFNVGNGESVKFVTPGANAATLNRVVGQSPSEILGSVSSNGQFWLINPNGIMFGQNAQVNVAGMVASTLNITDENFLKGNYSFEQQGGNLAKIVNKGHINADGGYVAMMAPQIENTGIVEARLGTVAMGAGTKATLEFQGNQLLHFAINDGADVPMYDENGQAVAALKQAGTVQADGGQVLLTADSINSMLDQSINVVGVIKADTVEDKPGKIVLLAKGDTIVDHATLSATGTDANEKGGTIQVLGNRVGLLSGTSIDASGNAGGGTVLIGGDYQGKNPEIQNAEYTTIQKDVSIKANALQDGNGGKVIAWSDNSTRFYGNIEAAGAGSGTGGFVETSGHKYLDISGGIVSTVSQNGSAGIWLLDPSTLTITNNGGTNSNITSSGTPTNQFSPTDSTQDSTLDVTQLQNALLNSNILVQTANSGQGNIVVASSISYGGTNSRTLTLTADGSITINTGVSINESSSGALSLVVNAGNAVTLTGGSSINVHGSVNVTANTTTSNTGVLMSAGAIQANTNTITLQNNSTNFSAGTAAINLTGISGGAAGAIAAGTINISAASGDIQQTNTGTGGFARSTNILGGTGANALNLTMNASKGYIVQESAAGINLNGLTNASTISLTAGTSTPAATINLSGQNNQIPQNSTLGSANTLTLAGNTSATPIAFSLYNASSSSPASITLGNSATFSSFSFTSPSYNSTIPVLAGLINNSVLNHVASNSAFDLTLALLGFNNPLVFGIGGSPDITLPSTFHNLTATIGGNLTLAVQSGTFTANQINLTSNSGGVIVGAATASNTITASDSMTLKAANTTGNVQVNNGQSGTVYTPTLNVEIDGTGGLILNNVSPVSGSGIALNVTNTGTNAGAFTSTNTTYNTFNFTANNLTVAPTVFINTALANLTSTADLTLALGGSGGIDFATLNSGTLSLRNLTASTNGTINLSNLTASGALTLTSTTGAIQQQAGTAATVTGTTTLTAASGVNLNNATNDFGTVNATATAGAGNIVLTDKNAIAIGTTGITTNNGAITITAGNGISIGGNVNAGSAVINLDSSTAGNISQTAGTISSTNVGNAITMTAAGTISQSGGSISATSGTNTFTAHGVSSGWGIDLNQATNDFGTVVATADGTAAGIRLQDANNINFGNINSNGAFTVTAGTITQSNATSINASSGTTTLSASGIGGGSSILLNQNGNDFNIVNATATASGQAITLYDTNAINISGISTSGGIVTVHSGVGGGAGTTLTVSGAIDTTTGTTPPAAAINLSNASANASSGGISIGGNLTVGADSINVDTAQGNISQTSGTMSTATNGAIALTATAGAITSSPGASMSSDTIALTTGSTSGVNLAGSVIYSGLPADFTITLNSSGSVTMNNVTNTFSSFGNTNITGAGILTSLDLSSASALSLGAITTTTGGITVTGGAGITTTGALTAAGHAVSLTATAGNIGLGANISAAALTLAVQGTGATITQSAGAINATGTTTLTNSGSNTIGAISLNQATNDFATVQGSGTLAAVTLSDANALVLGALSSSGLTVTTAAGGGTVNGALTQSGALTLTGASSFTNSSTSGTAANKAITLTNASNDFGNQVVTLSAGGDIQLTDNNATGLLLGNVSAAGLTLKATGTTGAISQNTGAAINATSTALQSAGNVTLSQAGGSYGVISTIGTNIAGSLSVTETTATALTLGAITSIGLTASTLGALTQSGVLSQTGAVSLTGASITNSANISASGQTVSLNSTNSSLSLSHNITAGDLTLSAQGVAHDITQSAGAIFASNTSLEATGNVTLSQAGSSYGTISTIGTNVAGSLSVTETTAAALTLGDITSAGLTANTLGPLTQNGTLTQTGAVSLNSGGITSNAVIDASGQAVTLNSYNNGNLRLNADIVAGDLTLIAGGGANRTITQSAGTITATTTALQATGNVSLHQAGGSYGTISTTGTNVTGTLNVTETDATDLTLGAITSAGLTASTLGALTQSGDLTQTGTVSLAGASITNSAAISASGRSVTLNATDGDLSLGQNVIAGVLTLKTAGTNHTITQAAGTINATSTALQATGDVTLSQTGGSYGTITTTGTNVGGTLSVTETDATALTLGAITSAGLTASTLAALTQSGALSQTGTVSLTGASIANSAAIGAAGQSVGLTATSGNISLGANLTVADLTLAVQGTGATINQSAGTITATGTTTLTNSGSNTIGAISLNQVANNFATVQGSGTLAGVTLSDANALVLGALSSSGLTVTTAAGGGAVNGALTQSGALTLTGASSFTNSSTSGTAANKAITLTNASNDFGNQVVTLSAGGDIQLTDNNATGLLLGNVSAAGLTLKATGTTGAISQNTGAVINATSTALQATGNVTLSQAGGSYGTITTTGTNVGGALNVTETDATALTLGAITTAGDLTAQTSSTTGTGAAITGSSTLNVGGTTTLNAKTAAINLSSTSNTFGGTVTVGGTGVASGAVTLGANSSGILLAQAASSLASLSLTTNNGAINQSGVWNILGATTLNAGTSTITANNASGFGGTVTVGNATGSNGAVSLSANSGGITLAQAGGTLASLSLTTANGAIGQSGAWNILGATNLNAGNSTITANSLSNNFGGIVTVSHNGASSGNVILGANSNGITFTLVGGGSDFNSLTVTTDNGAINGSGIYLDSIATLNAGTNDITLSGNNYFGGTVTVGDSNARTGAVTIHADTGNLVLADAGGGMSSLALTMDSGGIGQSGAWDVSRATTLNAGTGNIDIWNMSNRFGGTVTVGQSGVTSGTVRINANSNGVTIAQADNNANTKLGSLSLSTNNGVINQSGALNVVGTTSVNAESGAVTLTNASNDFGNSTVTLTGSTVQITDANATGLTLGVISSGALTATAAHALTQAGAITASGTTNLTGASIANNAAISAGAHNVNLTATSGNITQTGGSITSTGTTTVNATGNVTLGGSNAISTFTTGSGSVGGALTLNNAASTLTLGAIDPTTVNITNTGNINLTGALSAGALTLQTTNANAAITQATGANITTTGITTLTTNSGDITLTNSNSFGGNVAATGKNISLTQGSGNLGLGAITATGDVTVLAQSGTLTLNNTISSSSTSTNAVVLSAEQLNNQFGAGAINLTGGGSSRWLIYLTNLTGNTFGGLNSGNQAIWGTSYPTSISQSGNRYVFGTSETLTLATTIPGGMDLSAVYGDGTTLPTPTSGTNYTATGFVNASDYGNVFTQDTAANTLNGLLSFTSTGAATTANVGTYDINMSAPATSTNGYTLATNDPYGTLTVTARPITLKADNVTNTYGDGAPSTDSYTVTSGSLANGNTISSLNVNAVGAGSQPNVGSYVLDALSANFSSGSASNYAITLVNGTFTVTPATLTITADNKFKYQGADNPTLTASYSGFKYSDSASVVSGLVLSTDAVTSSPVGNYAITPSGASAANYTISYVDGTMSVLPSGGGGGNGGGSSGGSGSSGGVQPSPTVTNNPAVVANNVVTPQPLTNIQVQETNPNLSTGGVITGNTNIICHYNKEEQKQECVEGTTTESERG